MNDPQPEPLNARDSLATSTRSLAAVPDHHQGACGFNPRLAVDAREAVTTADGSQDDTIEFNSWTVETFPSLSLPVEMRHDPHVRLLWTRIRSLEIAATALGDCRARVLAELRLVKGDLAQRAGIEPRSS